MVKILSQSGNSLADMYDVVGSVAGIEQLETRELPIVHEMGRTIFSERFSTIIRRQTSGAVAQNTDINIVTADLPSVPSRLLGVAVISDSGARILRLTAACRSSQNLREFPVWVYDGTNFLPISLVDNGAAVAQFDLLLPNAQATMLPSFTGGSGQPQVVEELALRGRTTGFGAGTVFVRVLYYLAFAQITGISSRGLPIPSW